MPSRINQPLSNPYGGAALLDSTPFLQLHLQQQAKEGAKVAAAQKAYDDLLKDPNPDGLREVDTKGFYDRVNQWRDFGIKNKDLIKDPSKDGGKARNELMRRANEIALYTQSSKDRKAQQTQFAPMFQNPETARRLKNSFLGQYSELQKPLDQSQAFQFNPNSIFKAKDFDPKKLSDFMLQGETPNKKFVRTEKIAGQPLRQTEVYELDYSDKKKLADKARNYYKTNDSMKDAVDDIYEAEGLQLDASGNITRAVSPYMKQLNDLHTSIYGKPIQTKDDIAAAYGLTIIPSETREDKVVENKGAIMKKADDLKRGTMAYGKFLNTPKEPETVTVEDFEKLVRTPDSIDVKDKTKTPNLIKAMNVVRQYSAATINNVGDGAFISPLPLSSSMKPNVTNNPQYNKLVNEGISAVQETLANDEKLVDAYKDFNSALNSKDLNNEKTMSAYANALNAINKRNGITQRYTANDLRKETPVIVKYQKGDKLITGVVKLGSQEFRVAYDAAKKIYKKVNTKNVTEGSFGSQSESSGGSVDSADDL